MVLMVDTIVDKYIYSIILLQRTYSHKEEVVKLGVQQVRPTIFQNISRYRYYNNSRYELALTIQKYILSYYTLNYLKCYKYFETI